MFIKKMPDTPEIINCHKHGSFNVKYMKLFGGKIMETRECSDCIIERDEQSAIDERRKRDEQSQTLETKKRLKAGISQRNINKTFDDYICNTREEQHVKTIAENFVKNFPGDQNILMLGSVGTGKTLLSSVIIEALLPDYQCLIIKVMDIVRAIKGTWGGKSERSESDLIDILINKDLLVIDEVGTQFGSDTEKLFIFDIIDGRYQAMKPTILISNLDVDGVKKVIGDRCVDRLREGGGKMIAFDWESKRK
jgi:DNA replication protein DnaC